MNERDVGGLRCSEVLAHLSDFIDGELSAELKAKVLAHLAGCPDCERFGGEFAKVVATAKARLTAADELPAELRNRLEKLVP